MSRILFENRRREIVLVTDFGVRNSVFEQILAIRRMDDQDAGELPCDSYSHHYLLVNQGQAAGTISVTAARDGAVECQACYPDSLFKEYGHLIETAYSFRILQSQRSAFSSIARMFREIWRDRLPHGSRIHLVNATGALVERYENLGYLPLYNASFIHPRLNTPSIPMLLVANPNYQSVCQGLFTMLDDPVSREDVLRTATSIRCDGGKRS